VDNSILFSSSPAEELNNQVVSDISKHLYIVCNYNPSAVTVFSDDAKFISGVLNLYKFLIDANIWKKLEPKLKKYNISCNYPAIDGYISIISSLRAVLSHNKDNASDDDLRVYNQWISDICGKRIIDTSDDYKPAILELERIEIQSKNILSNAIRNAKHLRYNSSFIEDWEDCIISFYCKGNCDIIRLQLKEAYLSLHTTMQQKSNLKYQISLWVEKGLHGHYLDELQNCKSVRLNYGNKLSNEQLTEVLSKEKELNTSITTIENDVRKFKRKRSNKDLNNWDYFDYYISMFEKKLKYAIKDIKAQNMTMLPQDIIQMIIYNDLKNVSSNS